MIKWINEKQASHEKTKAFVKLRLAGEKRKQFLVLGLTEKGCLYQIISSNELPPGLFIES